MSTPSSSSWSADPTSLPEPTIPTTKPKFSGHGRGQWPRLISMSDCAQYGLDKDELLSSLYEETQKIQRKLDNLEHEAGLLRGVLKDVERDFRKRARELFKRLEADDPA